MRLGISVALVAVLAATPALAKKSHADAVKLLDSLEQCQSIADSAQRLACFDQRIGELKVARAEDKKLFTPQAKAEFQPISATAVSVAELEPGTWLIVLSDHSVWRTDDIVRFVPKSGDKVRVVKGALGSYNANIGDQRSVKVRQMR